MSNEDHLRAVYEAEKQLRAKYESWNQELLAANATLQKKLEVEKAESEKVKAELETAREGTPTTEAGRNSEERTKREGKKRMRAVVEIPVKSAKVGTEMTMGSRTEAKRRTVDESELVKLRVQERIELDNRVKELEGEVDRLKGQVEAMVGERGAFLKEVDRLCGERDVLEAKGKESAREKARLQNLKEALTGENYALKVAKEQVIEERDRLRTGMDELKVIRDELMKERDSAMAQERQSLSQVNGHILEMGVLKAERDKLAAEVDRWRREREDQTQREAELEKRALEARSQVAALRKDVRALTDERNGLRQRIGGEVKTEDVDVGQLTMVLQESQMRCDELSKKLMDAEKTITDLQNPPITLKTKRELELEQVISATRKELQTTKLSLDVSMVDGMTLRENDRAKDERLREYEARLDSAYEQAKHLNQQIDQLEAENEELVERYSGGGSKRRRFYTSEHSEYDYVSGSSMASSYAN